MLNRVVICLNRNTLSPNAIFGPFVELKDIEKFLDNHKKICKLIHIRRKLHDPKFGVKDV